MTSTVTSVMLSLALLLSPPLFGLDQRVVDHPRVAEALRLLEVWVDAERDYQGIPGMSMGVVHDQELLWSRGFGFAHLETQEPATPATLYSICSISKLFTSVALMQLRDAGKLRLDDPVVQLLPWFTIQQTYPDAPPITVSGILTHSSGLPRESDYPYWTGPEFPFPTREQVIERVAEQSTLYPADRYFQYSNLGLTLAGEVVAAVSGLPYADYVKSHVLEPLGLRDTSPEIPREHAGGRLATGYSARTREGSRTPMPLFETRGIAPAAGYSSSVEDLARFASWQFSLLGGERSDVLSANTLREMQRVHFMDPDWKTTWGLGFAVWRSGDDTLVGHGGSCPGFRSQLALSTKDEIAVVFMSNAMGVDTRKFTDRAYALLAPAIENALEGAAPAKPADATLERYTGLYRSDWGEQAIVPWEGELAVLPLPAADPGEELIKLRRLEGDSFRRVRDDGELGETWTFKVGENGEVVSVEQHSNYARKVR